MWAGMDWTGPRDGMDGAPVICMSVYTELSLCVDVRRDREKETKLDT
jgi:hypothetical protein